MYNGLGDKMFDADYRTHHYRPPRRRPAAVYPYSKSRNSLSAMVLMALLIGIVVMIVCR